MNLLWLLVIVIVLIALFGGILVSKLLWLLLIVALIVAIFSMISSSRV